MWSTFRSLNHGFALSAPDYIEFLALNQFTEKIHEIILDDFGIKHFAVDPF